MGRRGQQKQGVGSPRQKLRQFGPLRVRPCRGFPRRRVMRLVDDDQVPVGVLDRVPDLGVPLQRVDRHDGPIELIEYIIVGGDPVPHTPDRSAVQARQWDREPGPEFLLELGEHRPCRDDEDPVRPSA